MFSQTLRALGFTHLDFRPYSLPRGGATFMFRQQGSLYKLLIHGRWHSSKTARVYHNEGLAICHLGAPNTWIQPLKLYHSLSRCLKAGQGPVERKQIARQRAERGKEKNPAQKRVGASCFLLDKSDLASPKRTRVVSLYRYMYNCSRRLRL